MGEAVRSWVLCQLEWLPGRARGRAADLSKNALAGAGLRTKISGGFKARSAHVPAPMLRNERVSSGHCRQRRAMYVLKNWMASLKPNGATMGGMYLCAQ